MKFDTVWVADKWESTGYRGAEFLRMTTETPGDDAGFSFLTRDEVTRLRDHLTEMLEKNSGTPITDRTSPRLPGPGCSPRSDRVDSLEE